MKILSVKQPYASLLVAGIKDIENRGQRTHYRGPLIIHASAKPDRAQWAAQDSFVHLCVAPDQLPLGQIIGVVDLFDCVDWHPSPWFHGPWGWRVRDARELDPIPFKGALGLITPSADILKKLGLS